jgi:hypothetical protein
MMYFTKKQGNRHVYDPEQIWAYEGCILPGGRIIVGRWWDPTVGVPCVQSGPFIWWNVDRSTALPPITEDEAHRFFEHGPPL